ncbi:MAG: dihydroorotate dehydrogenase electron transfer subunit [Eubacteriales bacterium]|nr:dihydroorotate dehydrogenase electron transfer subunit [Eubacteriales bacterium]
MKELTLATVLSNRRIAQGIYQMRLDWGKAPAAQPGQYVHVKIPGDSGRILRRPISICRVEGQVLTLVYQLVGEGTRLLSLVSPGQRLDCMGPLGRGFVVEETVNRAAVVGGGIGAAPLLELVAAYPHVAFDIFLGFRTAELAYDVAEFKRYGTVHLYTDDGSLGQKGFATQGLKQALEAADYQAVYACGPQPMLKSLQRAMQGSDIPCYASLEERMACGVGACLGCVCKIKAGDGWQHQRVCADGPVFPLSEVILDD